MADDISDASSEFLQQASHAEGTKDFSADEGLQELKTLLSSCKDIGTDSRFRKLSNGMNKSVHFLDPVANANKGLRTDLFSWVLLAATSGIAGHKWRAQEAEINTLKALSENGIPVPKTDFTFQKTKLNGKEARVVLQEKLDILAELGRNEHTFFQALARIGLSGGQKKKTIEADVLRDHIGRIWNYLQKSDIHDFQACLARNKDGTARILVIDPGDPSLSSSYREKHLFWVKSMAKAVGLTLNDHREI